MVGAVQSILSKSAKCALFDPTLQMAYIPLDHESKVILVNCTLVINFGVELHTTYQLLLLLYVLLLL
jgi:ATP/ADP translocase